MFWLQCAKFLLLVQSVIWWYHLVTHFEIYKQPVTDGQTDISIVSSDQLVYFHTFPINKYFHVDFILNFKCYHANKLKSDLKSDLKSWTILDLIQKPLGGFWPF